MAPIHDETLPTPLRKTWPVVPGPSPPRPEDREPRARALADHRPRTVDLLSALPEPNRCWMILPGPWSVDQLQGLLCLIAKVEPYDLGTGTPNFRASRLGPRAFSISRVNSFGGNFVFHHQLRKQTLRSPSTNG